MVFVREWCVLSREYTHLRSEALPMILAGAVCVPIRKGAVNVLILWTIKKIHNYFAASVRQILSKCLFAHA